MAAILNSTLMNIDTGILKKDACIVIVRTEWNEEIVGKLQNGCIEQLEEWGFQSVESIMVPGAFEIPFAIKNDWEKRKSSSTKPVAYIAFACIIKGDTPHFDYVCKAVTEGIVQLNLTLPIPSIFGVLTVNNMEQAEQRAGGIHGHKGKEAAAAAIKMAALCK
jgi:6,7-dimethyl-8-ribityllumazine synthase